MSRKHIAWLEGRILRYAIAAWKENDQLKKYLGKEKRRTKALTERLDVLQKNLDRIAKKFPGL